LLGYLSQFSTLKNFKRKKPEIIWSGESSKISNFYGDYVLGNELKKSVWRKV